MNTSLLQHRLSRLMTGAVLAALMLGGSALTLSAVTSRPVQPKNAPAQPKPSGQTSEEEPLIALINRALPSVVGVVGSRLNPDGTKNVIDRGTGFIADSRGLLLTNKHVVSDPALTYTVYFNDGRRYTATVLGRDPLNDLAILQIPGDHLPALALGDSDNVRIGQTAVAIGNSLGRYLNTVTRGIISGIGRSIVASDNAGANETLDDVLQTDAAINPGNSGGPLLNSRGEVIGIDTAIEQEGRGVGFAIPINEAVKALESYRIYRHIVRPYLGLRYVTVTPDIQDVKKLRYDYGAYISAGDNPTGPAIVPAGPADRAGLREGDIVLSVNGILVRGSETLRKIIQRYQPGGKVTLWAARSGPASPFTVTLDEVPESVPQ